MTAIEDSDNGVIGNVLRWLGRPGFATRSLLSGDFIGAGKNALQFALDLPTGGFLNRNLSLANILDDDGDITTRKERPEFTDLIHRWGADSPASRGFWANLGLDIAGGIVTDPLTLLTGPVKGVATGAVAGAERGLAAAAIKEGLTSKGLAQLARASDTAAVRLARGAAARLKDPESLAFAEGLANKAEVDAIEKMFGRRLGRSDELVKAEQALREFEKTVSNPAEMLHAAPEYQAAVQRVRQARAAMTADVDGGIAHLRQSGLIGPGTGVRFAGYELPDAWKNIGRFATLPGLAREALSFSPRTKPIADAADALAERSWDFVRGALFNKRLGGGPEVWDSLRDVVSRESATELARNRASDRAAQEILGHMDTPSREAFGKLIAKHEELYRHDIFANKAATADEVAMALGQKAVPPAVPGQAHYAGNVPFDELIRVPEAAPYVPRIADPAKAMAAFREEAKAINGVTDDVIDRYFGEYAKQQDELIRAGLWKDLTRDVPPGWTGNAEKWAEIARSPFYLPHQLAPAFHEILDSSFKNKKMIDEVRDVFTGARGHTAEQFTTALKRLAAEHGVPDLGIDLQDFDTARLLRRRSFAHNRTMARHAIVEQFKKAGMSGLEGAPDPLREYLTAQFAPTMREAIDFPLARGVSKILGGGEFVLSKNPSPDLLAWAARRGEDTFFTGRVKHAIDGTKQVVLDWPGINYLWKAPMTSAGSLGFHVRNALSAAVMSGMDEEIGWAAGGRAAKSIVHSIMNLPIVRQFTKAKYAPDEIGDVVNLLSHDPAERLAALGRLDASGKKVGKYSWSEVAKILDGSISERVNMLDFDKTISSVDAFGRDLVGSWREALRDKKGALALKRAFQSWVKIGQDMSSAVESRFRASAMLKLLEGGMDPVRAAAKVEKAFVGYSVNSTTERFLRDVIPFLRFQIGSTAWVKSIANRPRLVGWLGSAQRSAQNQTGGVAPESVGNTLALPLPWRTAEGNVQFLSSLGLPQEVALNVLGAGASPEGFRRMGLAGLHPAIRLPLEAATNRSFFFGEEFAQYRRAPAWMPDVFTQQVGDRREISGVANEIINALPSSKLDSQIHRMLDPNTSWGAFLLNALTGARTIEVDERRELAAQLGRFLKAQAADGTVGSTLVYFARKGEGQEIPPEVQAALDQFQALRQRR